MSRSFFLAGLFGIIAVSAAHASSRALKKVDSISRRAAVILPGSLLKAQSFRFPAQLGASPAPKSDVKTVSVGAKPKFEQNKKFGMKMAAGQPVLGPYLRNNQSWQQATAHVQDPRFVYIEPIDQNALRAEYAARQAELDTMLPQADSLDTQDDQLVARKQDLDTTYSNLQQESANYNGQVNSHNAQCNPAPDDPTYQWCLQDGARLDAWKATIQTEIDNYTAAANQYNTDVDAFKGSWDAFVQTISGWEAQVKALIQKIEASFAKLPPAGQCVLEKIERNSSGQAYNCQARCNRGGAYVLLEFRPYPTGKPCGADEGGFFPDPNVGSGLR